ncbi:regulator of microtubule dynamics protein 1-like protein [Leptotrombidium deliense]|uniref:Regulator of microtubule dynamics protein 1 n=1 Tax=Leptotrombidium deliense TaxID=299467 RepID=A0A443ST09_9ACAR|nr:regulator of microtubule dynamics protein 1-like protein [Leptotrombidium deliense]
MEFNNRFAPNLQIGLRRNGWKRRAVVPTLLPTSLAFAWSSVDAKLEKEEKRMLQEADRLFDEHKMDQLLMLLKSIGNWYDNSEVLWRVARCEYHKYKESPDSKEGIDLLRNAYLMIEKSLEINNDCGAAHKWAAILLDAVSSLDGTKSRITQLLNVRKHMEMAITLTPSDPTSYYLLGNWHYSCHQVSWVEKQIASTTLSVLFGSLPEADLETALNMFNKAESLEPGFYSQNEVLIAKTLIALNRDVDKAKEHLHNVVKKFSDSKNWDDVEACKEAKSCLKKLGESV